jgi:hypothetical protein
MKTSELFDLSTVNENLKGYYFDINFKMYSTKVGGIKLISNPADVIAKRSKQMLSYPTLVTMMKNPNYSYGAEWRAFWNKKA